MPGEPRRVQVWDGDGDCVLSVAVVDQVNADWLTDFLRAKDVGDVYDDAVPAAALPPVAPNRDRLLTAIEAAILNIQHNRIGAAIEGLRTARDLAGSAE